MQELINAVFINRKRLQFRMLPLRMATWQIREALGNRWSCEEIRKELRKMEKLGILHYDKDYSRRGNSVWRYDK